MRKFALVLALAVLATMPALAGAPVSCQHMCPAAQTSYDVGYEAVCQLQVMSIQASELE